MLLPPKRLIARPLITQSEARTRNASDATPALDPFNSIFKTALVPCVRAFLLAPVWV
jgi:hypothetical protein